MRKGAGIYSIYSNFLYPYSCDRANIPELGRLHEIETLAQRLKEDTQWLGMKLIAGARITKAPLFQEEASAVLTIAGSSIPSAMSQ